MNQLVKSTGTATMTSLELVGFINSQRGEGEAMIAHSDFLKKVPIVLGEEVAGKFSCYYRASNGKQNPMYRFPKREACLMAMSYSYDLQAKVFDRMTELEQQAAAPQQTIQSTKASAPRLSVVAQDWKAAKALAKARGLNDNHSILSADKAALTLHGLDVPALLGAPVLKADERGLTLTPGEALRMLPRFASLHIQHAGRIANAMLENNGYLVKSNGQWEPTDKAKSLGEWGDVNTSHGKGSPKKQWRWFKEIVGVLASLESANDDEKSAA